jgi:SAM-dependent methyltransferase
MDESTQRFATAQTAAFVAAHVPLRGARVLEVGCGDGDLAACLAARGAEVVGVDVSADAVRRARARGVDARHADFLAFRDAPFDAVLCTRSLHHIHDLDAAVERAFALLRPGGTLLLDEFDLAAVDAPSLRWYFDLRFLVRDVAGGAGGALIEDDVLGAWRDEHAHEPPLHEGAAMIAAVERRFGRARIERGPYYWISICSAPTPIPLPPGMAEAIWRLETLRIRQGSLRANGLRVLARA